MALEANEVIGAALAGRDPRSPFLVDASGTTTVGDVVGVVEQLAHALSTRQFRGTCRVGVVMPNGRTMATVVLAAMSVASCAPINPRLSESEMVEAIEAMELVAVIVGADTDPAAGRAANRCGIGVLRVDDHLVFEWVSSGRTTAPERSDGVALLLQTSGTTARPKLVGLTAGNLISSASSVSATLRLSGADRCLSVMPLFHIHGLVGILLSSLVGGASVETRSGFDPVDVRRRLTSGDITWMSAVPSIYRSMLRHADGLRPVPALRLLRSSSAALLEADCAKLEATLGCPVINAYGMTEASHQMTSNLLSPGGQRIGTVGCSAGAEIAVLDHRGVSERRNTPGEVVVRGQGIMAGYLAPTSANDDVWHDGWLRTGDSGSIDDDGYLTLVGRIKEIINVAGEKVSPFEVEAVLLRHPDVDDAAAFAVPDRIRGERVSAAVVMRAGASSLDERALRRYVAEHLVSFKVPRQIVAVDRVPLGPTGKVQRNGLAKLLGLGDGPTATWCGDSTDRPV